MNVRIQGLAKAACGGVLTPIALFFAGMLAPSHASAARIVALPIATLGLTGLIEAIGGIRFFELSRRWESWHPLARFGLGLVILAATFVAFVGVFYVVAHMRWVRW